VIQFEFRRDLWRQKHPGAIMWHYLRDLRLAVLIQYWSVTQTQDDSIYRASVASRGKIFLLFLNELSYMLFNFFILLILKFLIYGWISYLR